MINEREYVELGLACGDICRALERGISGKEMGDLNQSVCDAITWLTMWVQPVMPRLDNVLMILLIVELWRISKQRSSNRVDGTQSLDISMRRRIRK